MRGHTLISVSALFLAVFVLVSCGYVPARFADRPAVSAVGDDRPIPIPRKTPFIEPFYLSDVYLRRPIVDALDTERFPYAKDVNALDEVPRSSWFSPVPLDPNGFARAYAEEGPPVPPVRVEQNPEHALVITDSRGRVYELRSDIENLEATSTAAGVIASRLARAIGYRTPEAWLVDAGALGLGQSTSHPRLLALRWPIGVEIGPTDMTYPRGDDANDKVSHRDRRTLRALGVLAAWLDLHELGPNHLLDVYVGRPGRGHVIHVLTGLDEAIGASSLGRSHTERTVAGVVRGSPLKNLVTLGLARPSNAPPQETTLRIFPAEVKADYELSQPWEPVDRLLPSDGYWLAKRIHDIPSELIDAAIQDAKLPADVARHVKRALEARRQTLVAHWFDQVTPCEFVALNGQNLVLEDQSAVAGAHYEIELLDSAGNSLGQSFTLAATAGEIEVAIAKFSEKYLVVRVTRRVGDTPAPRAFEAHLIDSGGALHLVGIRH